MLGIPFSIRCRRGILGIMLFVAFCIVSASAGSTDETCPTLSLIEFNLKPSGLSCTKETPCDEHHGDCDNNDECKGDLHCGTNNCVWGGGDDCCYSPTDYAIRWRPRCNGIDSGCCTADSPCKENDGDCDSNDDCEGDLICGDDNCIWGDRDDCCIKKSDPETQKHRITEGQWAKMKEEYMKCIKTPQCDGCVNAIQKYLPLLIQADKIGEKEVGEGYIDEACMGAEQNKYKNCRRSDYKEYLKKTFTLTDGVTLSKKNEVITIDGTVKGEVGGKRGRNYDTYYQKLRPIGLYAPKGKIVTIDVPKEMVGKLGVIVGLLKYGDQFKIEFPPTKKPVLKVASPWSGPIILKISNKNAIKGFFNITVNNALRTTVFTYGENTNYQWNNELKNYSPNWAVLKIPRQLDMLINSDRIKYVTDMEAAMARVKHTMDLLEEMMGLPPNSKPGADIWSFGFGGGGMRHGGVCSPGFSDVGAKYIKELLETGHEGVVLHEAGHGWCYDDLPSNGGEWTASNVGSSYIPYKIGKLNGNVHKDQMDSPDLYISLMYRMVAFDLYSNGKACGDAKFNKEQLATGPYDVCWRWLSFIPEKAHGWDIYAKVNKLVSKSTESYDSKSDRMIDLYCKATKHNMLPLFSGLYNLQPADNVRKNCEKLPKSELIGKWLDIVECVKLSMTTGEKDIRECARMQHFPKLKGLCVLSGVCQKDQVNNKQPTTMIRKFDLYGSTDKWLSNKYSADKKENCLLRAKDYFHDCKNGEEHSIKATFYDKESNYAQEFSFTYPTDGCTKEMPCMEDHGDCDNDDECKGDLRCGSNNCFWGDGDDCCYSNGPYTEAVHACLDGHNDETLSNISLEECKEKCSSKNCNSLDYLDTPNKWNKKYCYLSKETKATQTGDYKEPCYGDYATAIYLEKKPKMLK